MMTAALWRGFDVSTALGELMDELQMNKVGKPVSLNLEEMHK